MTFTDIANWEVSKNQRVHDNPGTIYYVTCDPVSTIEVLKHLDKDIKAGAMQSSVSFEGDAQAFAWRGEDYVRISSFGDVTNVYALNEQMKALTETDQECVICFEIINEEKAAVVGRTPFTCLHSICSSCFEKHKSEIVSCPKCRSTNCLQKAIDEKLTNATSRKGKKKERANRRRGR